MDVKEFRRDALRNKAKLIAGLMSGAYPGQPELELQPNEEGEMVKQPVAVYLTSLYNRDRMTTAGAVALVRIDLAAEKITDATHRVSTPEEIKAELKRQQDSLKLTKRLDMRDRRSFEVRVPQEAAS